MSLIVLAPQAYVDAPAPRIEAPHLDLSSPYPNPMRGSTRIVFALPALGDADVAVIDIAGRVVRSLEHGTLAAGTHVTQWDGRDSNGVLTAPGLYFVRLQTPAGAKAVRLTHLD